MIGKNLIYFIFIIFNQQISKNVCTKKQYIYIYVSFNNNKILLKIQKKPTNFIYGFISSNF